MELTISGIVIRDTLYKENDKLVTFLTAERGKITVLAKGVKSINSKNSPAVQLFCDSTFELNEKNGRYLLTGAEVSDNHYALRGDLERFSLASYFADVAGTVCTENNDESEMLRLMRNSFYVMEKRKNVSLLKLKATFEMQCMMIGGFMPDFENCADCGKAAVDSCDRHGRYLFSCSDGAFLCPDCLAARERRETIPLSSDTVECLRGMIRLPQNKMLNFNLPENRFSCGELFDVCRNYLVCQTGRRYETDRFFANLGIGLDESDGEKRRKPDAPPEPKV